MIVFLIMLILSAIKIISYIIYNKENKKIQEAIIEDSITVIEPIEENKKIKYNIDFKSLKEQNPDTTRDLLTPDEVKQLHYKTIIFPIIGYPIFRDTVIYSKFSCYKSGEISREAKSLKI